MKYLPACLTFFFIVFALVLAEGNSEDFIALVHKTAARFQTAKTLSFDFTERYSSADGETMRVESGRVFLAKPDKVRWEYLHPERKLFLLSGKHSLFYFPSESMAYQGSRRAWLRRQPLLHFFLQKHKVEDTFRFVFVQKKSDRLTFRVSLKRSSSSAPFLLTLNMRGDIVRTAFFDALDNLVEFNMENMRFDPPLNPKDFIFTPPPGTEFQKAENLP